MKCSGLESVLKRSILTMWPNGAVGNWHLFMMVFKQCINCDIAMPTSFKEWRSHCMHITFKYQTLVFFFFFGAGLKVEKNVIGAPVKAEILWVYYTVIINLFVLSTVLKMQDYNKAVTSWPFQLPKVIKTEFLLIISIKYQSDKGQEERKISIRGLQVNPTPHFRN